MTDLGGRFNLLLRVYELAAADLERLAEWPAEAGHYAGPIHAAWPDDRKALELEVAPPQGGRRAHVETAVRRLIPWVLRRFVKPEDAGGPALVLRFDGRFQSGGLLSVLQQVDPTHTSLFQFTGAERLSAAEPLPAASLSLLASMEVLERLVLANSLALKGALRLRVFALPRHLAPVLISCQSLDDERFSSVLPQVQFFIAPAARLNSLFLIGPRDSLELRVRLVLGDEQRPENSS